MSIVAKRSPTSATAEHLFFLFVYEISREPLNRFAPNSQGRRVWSLARRSLKVNVKGQGHQGQKRHCSTLLAACVRFMFGKTSLTPSFFSKFRCNGNSENEFWILKLVSCFRQFCDIHEIRCGCGYILFLWYYQNAGCRHTMVPPPQEFGHRLEINP